MTLERRAEDFLYVRHPDFDLFLLEFAREGDRVALVYYGGDRYVREGCGTPPEPGYPGHWRSYLGQYRARNAEPSNFRIAVRGEC